MKNTYTLAASIFFIAFLFSSCLEEGVTKTEVINVELSPNSDYSYVMPKGESDDMRITQQGGHFSKSEISTNSTSGVVFNYKPALDFEGSDEVKISNEKESNGKHGHCSSHQEDVTVYDFKITVKGPIKRNEVRWTGTPSF